MKINSFFNTFFLILYFLFINSLSFAEEWFTSSGNYNSLKYSKIKDINQNNLSDLEVAWIYKNGFVPDKNSYFRNNNQATPIFTGKYLISTSLDGSIIALDPTNGKEVWRAKASAPAAKRGLIFQRGNIFVPSGKA